MAAGHRAAGMEAHQSADRATCKFRGGLARNICYGSPLMVDIQTFKKITVVIAICDDPIRLIVSDYTTCGAVPKRRTVITVFNGAFINVQNAANLIVISGTDGTEIGRIFDTPHVLAANAAKKICVSFAKNRGIIDTTVDQSVIITSNACNQALIITQFDDSLCGAARNGSIISVYKDSTGESGM